MLNITLHNVFKIAVFLLSIQALNAQDFSLVGYASGTTGGQGGTAVTVSTGTDLQNAIKNKDSNPLIIYVDGTITPNNSSGLSKIDVKDVSDISIIGIEDRGELDGIGIKIRRASNVIIQNLKIHHVAIGDKDCIGIEGPADHIWIDHNELYNEFDGVDKDYYDGLLDAKSNVDNLTYSWNYLHDSWKSMLCGSSESDTHNRTVTIHHNYFKTINSRLPLFRSGQAHIFNNYYEDIETGAINSRINACVKIEANYFSNVKNPWYSKDSDIIGNIDESNNITTNSSFSNDDTPPGTCTLNLPYDYSQVLDDTANVPNIVSTYSGVGVSTLSVKEDDHILADNIFVMYPNPTEKGIVNLKGDVFKTTVSIAIYNQLGVKVIDKAVNTPYLDVRNFSSGLYFIKVYSDEKAIGFKKLLVK